jgi:alkylhydroperoxidase/carboxymuconolactone decarboxylase family protein YurZ
LVAVGGTASSYGALVDAAVNTGASPAQMVEVVVSVAPVIGLPRTASAAAALAMALGCDIDDGLNS